MLTISASFVNICWNEHSLKISMMLWFRGVCVCVSHLCSFLRCGPARSRSRRCSETFPAGSDTIRTHRCSGSYTRRCLPDDTHTEDRVSVCYCKRVCVSLCVCVCLPWQALLSSVGVKPISHSQRYPPGAFKHWPFSHRFTLSAHSSMSAEKYTNHQQSCHLCPVFKAEKMLDKQT